MSEVGPATCTSIYTYTINENTNSARRRSTADVSYAEVFKHKQEVYIGTPTRGSRTIKHFLYHIN